jgi:site-specific recombinase XerC
MTDQEPYQLHTIQVKAIAVPRIERIVDIVVNRLDSQQSKRAYRRALDGLLEWYAQHATEHHPGLTKATVNDYCAWMALVGMPESSLNQRLTAIRRLAREAADNGLIDDATARAIERVKGIARRGTPTGNWLTRSRPRRCSTPPTA